MVEAKDGHKYISQMLYMFLPSLIYVHMRSVSLCSKCKSLFNSESGKMDVVFQDILDITMEVLLEIFR